MYIVSSSRNQTIKIYKKLYLSLNKDKNEFKLIQTLQQYKSFSFSVVIYEDKNENIYIISSNDTKIEIWKKSPSSLIKDNEFKLIQTLQGHIDNVYSIDIHEDKSENIYIVSGSWDKTIKIWKNFELLTTLEEHSNSITSVVIHEDKNENMYIVSSSSDKTIKVWVKG